MRSLSVSTLLSLALCVSAGPLSKRTVTQAQYDQLALFGQYAAASYCPGNDGAAVGAAVNCPVGNCPKVEAANTSIVLSISASQSTDTACFVAIDNTNSLIVVSFRGSETSENYVSDFEATLESVSLCSGCEGFEGMYQAWEDVQSQVTAAVQSAQSSYPSYRIVTTGHSLGGGIAYVAAPALRSLGLVVDMAPFAAPRVGNAAWVNYVMDQSPSLGNNYRVVHLYDPIPSLPPTSSGFEHVSPEYFINALSGITPTPADIEVETGTDLGNTWGPSYTADDEAHDFYFNNITICYTSSGSETGELMTALGNDDD